MVMRKAYISTVGSVNWIIVLIREIAKGYSREKAEDIALAS